MKRLLTLSLLALGAQSGRGVEIPLNADNVVRTTHQAGTLAERVVFNSDGTMTVKTVAAFGVPTTKWSDLASISDINSQWTYQIDATGFPYGSNQYCNLYTNVDTSAQKWGDGGTTGEHGSLRISLWRSPTDNINVDQGWDVTTCGGTSQGPCALGSEMFSAAHPKSYSFRWERLQSGKLKFQFLTAPGTSASAGGNTIQVEAISKNVVTFNNGAGVVPVSMYCQYLEGTVGRVTILNNAIAAPTTTTPTTAAPTTAAPTTAAPTTAPPPPKSACGLTEWDLSDGELTGTSVTLGTSGAASAAVTIDTAYQFAKCTVPGDFKFVLYEVDTVNDICSTTAVATGLWTAKKVFAPTPKNTATTTARVSIDFSTAALAADLKKTKPQIYREGSTAGEEILSFCVRSTIEVDSTELKFSEMIVTATINTVLAIPAIENVNVKRPKAKVATTSVNALGTVNAYECYQDGNSFKGWLSGAAKPGLTKENNILTVCVTGVSTTVECKEFWDLSLKQGSKASDVRVDDGAHKKRLVTDVFNVQAITDTNSNAYKGCAAQLLLDASYFDSAKPEKVTLSGSVRMGLAASRRQLRGDDRSLHDAHDSETASFDMDVDRLQGSTSSSGVTTAALTTTALVLVAAVSM